MPARSASSVTLRWASPPSRRSTGREREPLLGDGVAQLGERHPVVVELAQEREPAVASGPLQPVEQALGGKVDLVGHRAPGGRLSAQPGADDEVLVDLAVGDEPVDERHEQERVEDRHDEHDVELALDVVRGHEAAKRRDIACRRRSGGPAQKDIRRSAQNYRG
jgi:hypothetical protein